VDEVYVQDHKENVKVVVESLVFKLIVVSIPLSFLEVSQEWNSEVFDLVSLDNSD
jgi:hypothetical protein